MVREAPDGSPFAPGDRVVAFTTTGAFGEVVAVVAGRRPARCRRTSGSRRAPGLPMNYLTAQFALVVRGHLRAGQAVLVHGAAGGVGTACIQLAAALGATVIAVVSERRQGRGRPGCRGGARRARRGVPRRREGAGRGRPRRRPGRRRPLHRLPAVPAPVGTAARDRLHRGRDPHGEGQPVAAQQHRRRGRRLGRVRAEQAGLRREPVGRARCRTCAPARSTRRSAAGSRWRRRPRRSPPIDERRVLGKIILTV